jgi:hypothetical protein
MLTLLALSLLAQPDLSVSRGYVKLVDDRTGARARIFDGGAVVITCPDGTCSGGGGSGGTTSVVTVDGGRIGAIDWVDGGYINATILGTPTVQGTLSVANFPGQYPGTVTIDGGVLGSVTWIDGGYINATILGTPTIQGTVSVAGIGGTTAIAGVVTIDGGRLGAVDWIDGGYINATILGTPTIQGTVSIGNFPTQYPGTVSIDGGGAAGTLGVNVNNFPTAYMVSIDGGPGGTLGVGQVGTWTDRVVGNAGGIFDSANNASAPANVLAIGVDTIASGSQPSAATSPNVRRPTAGVDGVLWTKPFGPQFFNIGIESGSTSPVVIKAAPGAGLRIYVTDIDIISSTMTGSGTWRLVTGTGGSCGVGTATLLPAGAAANRFWYPPAGDGGVSTFGQPLQMQFLTPIVAPANQDVCVVCVATNTCNAEFNGYIAP